MKERILVKYHYQNDKNDTTINCFSMLRDSEKPLKIIDVISEFPGLRVREYGTQGYHFRFFDKLGKLHCWVDIKNLNVQAPVIKNTIEVKVLLLPNQADSVIFTNLESSVSKYEEKLAQQNERSNPQSGGVSGVNSQATIRTQPLSQQMPTSDPKPKTQTTSPVHPASTGSKPGKAFSLQETDILGMNLGGSLGPSKPQSAGLDLDIGDFGISPNTKPKDSDPADILGGIHSGPAESYPKASPMDDLKMQEMFGEIDPTAKSLAAESKLREIQAQEEANKKIADRKRIEDENQRRIDAKISVADELEPKIKAWAFASNGSPNNIRILLSTLHTVVWEECDWESITMGELMTDAQVRSQYRKAITKVHPDHNSHITDAGSLFLMDRLFSLLNKAYTDTDI